MNLVLIGFMGVGKTIVGKRLAERLNYYFIDTDGLIEEMESMTIAEIFERYGETLFRKREGAVVENVSRLERCVIATGGGVVLNPHNIARLKDHGLLVHLSLSLETIYERIGQFSTRPLFKKENPGQALEALFRSREPLYQACSDITVDRNGLDVEETVEKVLQCVRSYTGRGDSDVWSFEQE